MGAGHGLRGVRGAGRGRRRARAPRSAARLPAPQPRGAPPRVLGSVRVGAAPELALLRPRRRDDHGERARVPRGRSRRHARSRDHARGDARGLHHLRHRRGRRRDLLPPPGRIAGPRGPEPGRGRVRDRPGAAPPRARGTRLSPARGDPQFLRAERLLRQRAAGGSLRRALPQAVLHAVQGRVDAAHRAPAPLAPATARGGAQGAVVPDERAPLPGRRARRRRSRGDATRRTGASGGRWSWPISHGRPS